MAESKVDLSQANEDGIDGYKIPLALKMCKQNGIFLDDKPSLDQMKLRLKVKLLCREKGRQQELTKMQTDYERNASLRSDMQELYQKIAETTKYVMKMDDPVVKELLQIFPNVETVLKEEIERLEESKAPILVLGETGAGKSSFINLLLGEDILPSSILSNTHVVCEIQHSEIYHASLFPISGEKKTIHCHGNVPEFRQTLGLEIQRLEDGKGVYKKAEIYLPCEFLKKPIFLIERRSIEKGADEYMIKDLLQRVKLKSVIVTPVTISKFITLRNHKISQQVDSPGIGENKEMENTVLEYILNACTFIYVIATDSAGGMQQRMQKLLEKVYSKALHEQRVYQPERALFICNKWDQAPTKERKEIKEDTVRKIMKYWPMCEEKQIFTFSTKEAADMIRMDPNKLPPKCQQIMQEINKLIPLGREIQIIKSFKYLDNFVVRCLHCFSAYLDQIKMSREDRQRKQQETCQRLEILKGKVESFFEEHDKALKSDIGVLAEKLKDFLREEHNLKTVCTFSRNEFAEEKDWKTLAVAIRSKVYERIMELINSWEDKKGEFKTIGDRISKSMEEEFPKFTAEIFKAQKNLNYSIDDQPSEDEYIMPKIIRKQFKGLNAGMKIAVGIGLAPVIFLGMAARLPVFGLRSLKKSIKEYLMESDFRRAVGHEDEVLLFERYARNTVEKITDKLELKAVIEAEIQPLFGFLNQQKSKIEGLINSDMELLKQMKEEERNARDIDRTYSPLMEKFMMLHYELENFLFINMPSQFSADYIEYPEHLLCDWKDSEPVCCGLEASVFPARLKASLKDGEFKDVCVRITREKIKPTNITKRKKIQEAYTLINRPFMVGWIGMVVMESNHNQILESIQCNLREWLPHLYNRHTAESWRMFLQGVTREIVSGLCYLHDKSLVHYDLSQDTIGVDTNGTIKLTSISVPRRLFVRAESVKQKLDLSRYIYIPERFIFSKESSLSLSSISSSSESYSGDKIRMRAFSASSEVFNRDTIFRTSLDSNSEFQNEESKPDGVHDFFETDKNRQRKSPVDKKKVSRTSVKSRKGSDDMYRMKDDMFSLGLLMWEIWVGKPLYSDDKWCEVSEIILKDTDKLRNFLTEFRPVKEPYFVSYPNSEDQIMSEWWTTIYGCMNRKITAADWLSRWEEIQHSYPDVSLIYSKSHFSMSPSAIG